VELDAIVDPYRPLTYAPEQVFLPKQHAAHLREELVRGPVYSGVEIEMPGDGPRLMRRPYRDYTRYGVPWHWLIRIDERKVFVGENENRQAEFVVRPEVESEDWFAPGLFPEWQVN